MLSNKKRLLGPTEAATRLGISRSTLHRMRVHGDIPAVPVGKQWRYMEEKIDKIVEAGAAYQQVYRHSLRGCILRFPVIKVLTAPPPTRYDATSFLLDGVEIRRWQTTSGSYLYSVTENGIPIKNEYGRNDEINTKDQHEAIFVWSNALRRRVRQAPEKHNKEYIEAVHETCAAAYLQLMAIEMQKCISRTLQ